MRLIPRMLQPRSMFHETELVGHGAEIPLLSDLLHSCKGPESSKSFLFTAIVKAIPKTNSGYHPPTTICAIWRGVGQAEQDFIGRAIGLPP